MLRDLLQSELREAVRRLIASGALPEGECEIEVADPKQPEHGDFSCNFAMVFAKDAGMNPRDLAQRLVDQLNLSDKSDGSERSNLSDRSDKSDPSKKSNQSNPSTLPPFHPSTHPAAHTPTRPFIASAEIAGPGFINFRLNPAAIAAMVPEILDLDERLPQAASRKPHAESEHGQRPTANGQRVRLNVEFVSVNPNGPITVGSGRGAAYGSTLCNVLEAAGNKVHREYYINDGTNSEQMRLLAQSVWNLTNGIAPPSNGYKGEYVDRIASAFVEGEVEYLNKLMEIADRQIERASHALEHSVAFQERGEVLPNWMKDPDWLRAYIDRQEKGLDALKAARKSMVHGQIREAVRSQAPDVIQEAVQELMTVVQREDLSAFSTTFHTWFSEQSLHDSGFVQECIDGLAAKGTADEEPYQLEIVKRRGEEDEVNRIDQAGEDGDDIHGKDAASREPLAGPIEPGSSTSGLENQTNLSNESNQSNASSRTLWLRSTKFADDKDRVLRRKDGRWTYIASDVAYHKSKFERGSPPEENGTVEPADKLITVLGPDHHGYIGRLRAVVAALLEGEASDRTYMSNKTYPLSETEALIYKSPEERDACLAALEEAKKRLEVIIFQIVRFVKDGKPAPMRKRDGNIYSLRDLMLEIGKNAAPSSPEEEQLRIGKDVSRFFYLMRSHDTHMDFDLDLAEKQSDDNPVYYVQYAHARICSVIKKAEEAGFHRGQNGQVGQDCEDRPEQPSQSSHSSLLTHPTSHSSRLTHPKELSLIKKICDLPFEVQRCAEDYGVHRLTTYAQDLARAFHLFYDACRVIQPENPELTKARLGLCEAARIGLKCTFDLLGISAPVRMEREELQVAANGL